jgi:hypothetical protein
MIWGTKMSTDLKMRRFENLKMKRASSNIPASNCFEKLNSLQPVANDNEQ